MNITEFKYRFNSIKEKALVLYRQGLYLHIFLLFLKIMKHSFWPSLVLLCHEQLILFTSIFLLFLLYSVGLHTEAELDAMVERLKLSQLHTINLTGNDLVKDHLRHLVRTPNT